MARNAELTLDNPEDQAELNRRLRKPGEPAPGPSRRSGHTEEGESFANSAGKKKPQRKGTW